MMDSTSMSEQSTFINIRSMCQFIINYHEGTHFRCAEHPFIDYDSNLSRIGVRHFTWKTCIEMFKSNLFLQTHSLEQNKHMIKYFYSKCSNHTDIPIEELPFLLDQNNRLQSIKDIYFPAETVGESSTSDSKYLFLNKTLFNWLNEYPQMSIKAWLKQLGVDERTDLSYLHKTIIPNALTYTTQENAIGTIRMLFRLFQNHHIEKTDLMKLKKLKLLTTRGSLRTADECFFSKRYKPRLDIEQFLSMKEDLFISSDYITFDIDVMNFISFIIPIKSVLQMLFNVDLIKLI